MTICFFNGIKMVIICFSNCSYKALKGIKSYNKIIKIQTSYLIKYLRNDYKVLKVFIIIGIFLYMYAFVIM